MHNCTAPVAGRGFALSALCTSLRASFPSTVAPLRRTALGACLGLLASGSALAQAADGAALETLVVTASGFEQEISQAPASISVITRQELEQGAYRNLHDALRDVPGVILTPSDNNSNDISLRGMGANYTLILVDGKRMSTRETQTNGSTGTDQSWIPPLEAIERIEVVRGPMSSLYGSDAMGGVINVITRKVAKNWHGSVRADATLQERSTSGDAYQTNFYLSGPIKTDLLGLSLYGNYGKRDQDRIYQGYNKSDNRSLNLRLALTPSKDHDLIAEIGTSRQHFVSSPGMTLLPTDAPSDRKFERENYSLQHKGRWGWASSDTYLQREETRNLSRDMTIRNTVFNSSWVAPLGRQHLLTTGVYYNQQDLRDTTTNTLPDSVRTTADRTQYAWFAEDEWRLRENFALTGGLRYDHDSKGGSQWSPRLYGVWNLDAQWTVKGGVSTGFRAPSLRQTLGDWGQSSRGGNIYGNPDLKPETSLSKELGVLYNNGAGLSAGLTVFDNEFNDKITRIACPECGPANSSGNTPTTNVNIDKAITRGVEATFKAPLARTLDLSSSYTFTKSEQKSGEFAGQPLSQLPRHMLNLALNWKPSQQWAGWAKLSYRGKESQPTGGRSARTWVAGSYAMFDMGGSYNYSKDVTFYAGIYNLFDKDVYYEDYATVQDGRRYWIGMNVKF
ncbi:ligand-gated channel protein [Delftia lacustris]|jgi:outer membrane receptor for ferrienterochelin and colicins|uniref:ligand-gated channel protein n=1 Tax=Delftia TaxID=80865 RepID=UPI00193B0F79|nr:MULTISPECIES: ligand-gated channel protein [Delftia]QRI90154.1 ligand-gated channel protein [Delftia lacustris]